MEKYIGKYKEVFNSEEEKNYQRTLNEIREKISGDKETKIKDFEEMADYFLKHLDKAFSYEELKEHLKTGNKSLELERLHILAIRAFNRIISEDLAMIVKKFPLMAIEKSFLLKSLYNYLKELKIPDNDKKNDNFFNIDEDKEFFRGCLFDEGKSPYQEEIPYLRMVQPPTNFVEDNGRFNISGQSRFYITDKKYGAYFELRKFEKKNKSKRVYIQTFKSKKEINEIIDLGKLIFGEWYEIGSLSKAILREVRGHSLRMDYRISNYFADIVQSANPKFLGISYPSAIFNNDSEAILTDKVLEYKNSYKNITFFSAYWDKEIYLENQLKKLDFIAYKIMKSDLEQFEKSLECMEYKLIEAKDYFDVIETELSEYTVEEVIKDFFADIQKDWVIDESSSDGLKINFEVLLKKTGIVVSLDKVVTCGEEIDKENPNASIKDITINDETLSNLDNLKEFFNQYFGIYYKMAIDNESNNIIEEINITDIKIVLVKVE